MRSIYSQIRKSPVGDINADLVRRCMRSRAFSLAEVLVVLTISSMILVTVLRIYSRTQQSLAAITKQLDSTRMPREVLQRIAEDLDRIVVGDQNTRIIIENKTEMHGFSTARLQIVKNIYDRGNKPRLYEKIVWQANYDSSTGSLVIYRSHSGLALEDKLLDEKKEKWERELFIPVCQGVTFFNIQASGGGGILVDKWNSQNMPRAVIAAVSFAEPFKTSRGIWDVPETDKISRIISVDRTRNIKFVYVPPQLEGEDELIEEPNDVEDIEPVEEPNDANQSPESE